MATHTSPGSAFTSAEGDGGASGFFDRLNMAGGKKGKRKRGSQTVRRWSAVEKEAKTHGGIR